MVLSIGIRAAILGVLVVILQLLLSSLLSRTIVIAVAIVVISTSCGIKEREREREREKRGKEDADLREKEKRRKGRGSPHLPPSSPPTCRLRSTAIAATLSLGHLTRWPSLPSSAFPPPPLLHPCTFPPHLPPLLLPLASAAPAAATSHRSLLSFPMQAAATSVAG
ncbi:hypothetical protein B296_00027413 [Ensete ventricosum]|uniref:Uncharacterized protein n=1 Tax=Ensete ventricosum TaxID=4639 RepID=A0A426XKL4_ENSVE|nr:hypothetical protein B296_00027413 [Ensete ventricosum]